MKKPHNGTFVQGHCFTGNWACGGLGIQPFLPKSRSHLCLFGGDRMNWPRFGVEFRVSEVALGMTSGGAPPP